MERVNKCFVNSIKIKFNDEEYNVISCDDIKMIESVIKELDVRRLKTGDYAITFSLLFKNNEVILCSIKFLSNSKLNNLRWKDYDIIALDDCYLIENINKKIYNTNLVFAHVNSTNYPFYTVLDADEAYYLLNNKIMELNTLILEIKNFIKKPLDNYDRTFVLMKYEEVFNELYNDEVLDIILPFEDFYDF